MIQGPGKVLDSERINEPNLFRLSKRRSGSGLIAICKFHSWEKLLATKGFLNLTKMQWMEIEARHIQTRNKILFFFKEEED